MCVCVCLKIDIDKFIYESIDDVRYTNNISNFKRFKKGERVKKA